MFLLIPSDTSGCFVVLLSSLTFLLVFALLLSFHHRFMVTLSQNAEAREKQNASLCDMIVWDVRKGTACRNFSGSITSWPTFKWSHDDAFVATLQGGKIYVYETESFKLLDKKPIVMPVSINDFAWSPTDNIISFWTPETNNTPARSVSINGHCSSL